MKILIATTNQGKFKEIAAECADLPFTFVSLRDIGISGEPPNEPHATTWENALEKARFYAKRSRLVTFTEDTGFFIEGLGGKPGVTSKMFGDHPVHTPRKIIEMLAGKRGNARRAYFETSACLFDPTFNTWTIFKGRVDGHIPERPVGHNTPGMLYDTIFFYPPKKKTLSQLSILEKNLVSHRGQVLSELRRFLGRQYGNTQFIVPLALLVKNRRLLLLQRRDARATYNKKWEFPGGGVDNGESVEECLHREVGEETGFFVKIVAQLPGLPTAVRKGRLGGYQVFLVCFLCTATKGNLKLSDAETLASRWVTYNEAISMDLLPLNKQIIKDNMKLLKEYID